MLWPQVLQLLVYILMSDIFDKIKQTEAGVNGEIQLTDAMSKLDEVYGCIV